MQSAADKIPWKLILSKRAVWALILSHFCHNWGTFILLTWMPTYYNQVRPACRCYRLIAAWARSLCLTGCHKEGSLPLALRLIASCSNLQHAHGDLHCISVPCNRLICFASGNCLAISATCVMPQGLFRLKGCSGTAALCLASGLPWQTNGLHPVCLACVADPACSA